MVRKLLKYLAIFIVGFFIIYQLVLSDLNPMFSSNEYKLLDFCLTKVDVQKHIRIIDLYKRINKVSNFNAILFSGRNLKNKYPSLEIVQDGKFGLYRVSKIPFVNFIFALKTERNHSLEKCIALNFEISEFLDGNRGVVMASKYYFEKNYNSLNEDELIKLIIISSNPSLYNPKKEIRRKRFENKLRLYKSIIQENKNKE